MVRCKCALCSGITFELVTGDCKSMFSLLASIQEFELITDFSLLEIDRCENETDKKSD